MSKGLCPFKDSKGHCLHSQVAGPEARAHPNWKSSPCVVDTGREDACPKVDKIENEKDSHNER